MGNARGHAGHQAPHRFYVAPEGVGQDRIRFSAAQQRQIGRVLRLPAGTRVVVFEGSGREIVAELRLESGELSAIPVETRPGRPEASCRVQLYQSALRGDHFTWLLQKGTEIGVSLFAPVLFARTQPADYAGRAARYETVVREAAEQCERSSVPKIEAVQPFSRVIERFQAGRAGVCLLLDEREQSTTLSGCVPAGARDVAILIGPEGGLTERERREAIAAGFLAVTLGCRVLRSETAGIVAATLVLGRCGDLG